MKTYKTLPLLDKIPLMKYPTFYDYDEERFIIEENDEYQLVNITTGEIEKKIDIKNWNINSNEFCLLRDKKTILVRKKNWGKEYFFSLLKMGLRTDLLRSDYLALIDDNTFASSVTRELPDIDVWKY